MTSSKSIPIRKTAWVTGSKSLYGKFELVLDEYDQDAAKFMRMNGAWFYMQRDAQNAANAIREFVRVQRQQRREAARKVSSRHRSMR